MLRVLLLVPDEALRGLRRLVLLKQGFAVVAPEPALFASVILNQHFDSVVINLRDENGVERLADAFRNHNHNSRVVVISLKRFPFADVTVDPFDPAALVRAVDQRQETTA